MKVSSASSVFIDWISCNAESWLINSHEIVHQCFYASSCDGVL